MRSPRPAPPFGASAATYDVLYLAKKDYAREVRRLLALIRARGGPRRGRWLEVCCGTGLHVQHLPPRFRAEGVDRSAAMLRLARHRLAGVALHRGDLRTFHLPRRFDVVSCLFSSIGYMTTKRDLHRAVANLARHVAPGGIVVVEPWWRPQDIRPDTVHLNAERDAAGHTWATARMIVTRRRGRTTRMDAHHLVGTARGIEHFVERHDMGLFTDAEMGTALRAAGLRPARDPRGISGRGLWIARAPARRPSAAVSARARARAGR